MDEGGGLQPDALERLAPSRLVSFSFPNPSPDPYAHDLRVAVLDNPLFSVSGSAPRIAAMLVPLGRESDWIFSTAAGHLQLLHSVSRDLPLSRLTLIGEFPVADSSPRAYTRSAHADSIPHSRSLRRFQDALFPLLLALCPKAAFLNGIPDVPFLSYEDDVVWSLPIETIEGPIVGEMLVEDVEIDASPAPERRRRLRFKKMPNLVQTQVRLVLDSQSGGASCPERGSLVQPYLPPMVAGLVLLAPCVEDKVRLGLRPRALCLGVGGGALLMFLQSKLDFQVLGFEADPVVVGIARRHFGLVEGESLRVRVADGIGFIENFALEVATHGLPSIESSHRCGVRSNGFDVIMVDLDAGDDMNRTSAPPLEFVRKNVLLAAKTVLHEHGVMVINVIPQGVAFYSELIDVFRQVFPALFEIQVGNGENYVLVASASPVVLDPRENCGSWIEELKQLVDINMEHCVRNSLLLYRESGTQENKVGSCRWQSRRRT